MQFTDEVQWSLNDFVLAGILLFGTGSAYIFIRSRSDNYAYRAGIGLLLFTSLFLMWSNLAVGLVGSENEPFNLSYFGVILTGIIGTLLSRFKPNAMSITAFIMAGMHVLLAAIALATGMQNVPGSSVMEIIGVNAMFMILFSLSGLLFRYAAQSINYRISSDSENTTPI